MHACCSAGRLQLCPPRPPLIVQLLPARGPTVPPCPSRLAHFQSWAAEGGVGDARQVLAVVIAAKVTLERAQPRGVRFDRCRGPDTTGWRQKKKKKKRIRRSVIRTASSTGRNDGARPLTPDEAQKGITDISFSGFADVACTSGSTASRSVQAEPEATAGA